MTDDSGRYSPGKLRAVWCNVLVPRPYKENGVAKGEPTFDATFELTEADVAPVIEIIKKVAGQKWPGRSLKDLKLPIRRAEVAIADAAAKGKDTSIYTPKTYLLEARSKYQPPLSWAEAGKLVEYDPSTNLNVAKAKFYNGCIVVPRLNFVIKAKNGDGVKAYLDMVFATVGKDGKPGKKIGGISAAEAFKGYIGEVSGEDPTGGQGVADLDDEIPF